MGTGCVDFGRTASLELFGCGNDRSTGIDHVVDEYTNTTIDLTNHVTGLDRVLQPLHAPLMNDGEIGVQLVGVTLSDLHAASIGRNNDEIVTKTRHEIDKYRHCREMVDWTIEESLDLTAVQVD